MRNKFLFIVVLFFYPVTCFAGLFGQDVRVNEDTTARDQHIGGEKTAVVVKGNTVYTVWQDDRNFSSDPNEFQKSDIYFSIASVSNSGNVTVKNNIKVNDYPGGPFRDMDSTPAIAVAHDGTIYIVWTDNRNVENQLEGNDIFLSRSTDGGRSFLTDQLVSTTQGFSSQASIAVSGSNVYVVYKHCCQPANDVIKFVKSTDEGQHFGTPQTITDGHDEHPVVAAEGEHIYVAFRNRSTDFEGDVNLIVSSDNGQTFSNPVKINDDNLASSLQTEISIACAGQNVYLVWRDGRDGAMGIYFVASNDYGVTFGRNNLLLPLEAGHPSTKPSISATGEKVALTYEGSMAGYYGSLIFASLSSDQGTTWSNKMVVSSAAYHRPGVGPSSISVSDKACCVFWVDGTESTDKGDDVYLDCYHNDMLLLSLPAMLHAGVK